MVSESLPFLQSKTSDNVPGPSTQNIEFRKDGTASKMRAHKGNVPVLPKSKLCPHCTASFTRTTHLNRHLRTHTNERQHRCDTCDASFTRSDLLTRHKRSCGDPLSGSRTRRKSCQACADSKIKCDLQRPCSKCKSRGKECIFVTAPGASSRRSTLQTTEENPVVDSDSIEGMRLADDLDSSMFKFDAGMALPSSLTSDNLSSLEHLTSSTTSAAFSDSRYTPTDLQSALSATNPCFSGTYSNDMFEPFFSNIFSLSTTIAATPTQSSEADMTIFSTSEEESFPFDTRPVDVQPFMASVEDEWFYEALANPSMFPVSVPVPALTPMPAALPPRVSPFNSMVHPDSPGYNGPPIAELQHYLYLFLNAFQAQVPVVHTATWEGKDKPSVLMGAAKACGALFVKTKAANNFVSAKLSTAREDLVLEFAKNPTESIDQVHLIIAVVLLQTIGLFHQRADERASSHIYHGMLVMMIRSTGLIARNASWVPPNISEAGLLDTMWREWAVHEMTKRALLLSYLHDACHCIYFAMSSSYRPNEMAMYLPCDDALWKASTATEWFLALQRPSPYGNIQERLAGVSLPRVLAQLNQQRIPETWIPLNPFSHFVLIHAILRNLFTVCLESRLPVSSTSSPQEQASTTGSNEEVFDQEIMTLQYALHNWLQSWLNGPDLPRTTSAEAEPPFICNALPFYWLGQVSLLAYQEKYPPFEPHSENNLKVEVRFRLVKQWLKHIRGFLKQTDQAPTLFWDELMRIRLRSWQAEIEGGAGDDQDGLLGFFPDI